MAWARVTGSIGSHYLYTGLFTFGLYHFYTPAKLSTKQGWFYVLMALLLHFAWNTPWNAGIATAALLVASGPYILIIAYRQVSD